MSLGMVSVRVGGGSRASNEPWAGCTYIHGNSESSNHSSMACSSSSSLPPSKMAANKTLRKYDVTPPLMSLQDISRDMANELFDRVVLPHQ